MKASSERLPHHLWSRNGGSNQGVKDLNGSPNEEFQLACTQPGGRLVREIWTTALTLEAASAVVEGQTYVKLGPAPLLQLLIQFAWHPGPSYGICVADDPSPAPAFP